MSASTVTSGLQLKIHLCEKQWITLIKPSLSMLMATFDILDFKKANFFQLGQIQAHSDFSNFTGTSQNLSV